MNLPVQVTRYVLPLPRIVFPTFGKGEVTVESDPVQIDCTLVRLLLDPLSWTVARGVHWGRHFRRRAPWPFICDAVVRRLSTPGTVII